jgi:hypothetical protein
MHDNGFTSEQVMAEMNDQIGCAFQWMPEIVTTLQYYTKHRSRYKTLADFYPEIAKCLAKYLNSEDKRINKALSFVHF